MRRIVLLAALIAMTASCAGEASTWSVRVAIFIKGTHRLYEYRLDGQRIEVEEFSPGGGPPKTIVSRELTGAEIKRLSSFFASFPLGRLKDRYEHPSIEGSLHQEYRITVNGTRKDVYVYFMKPVELARINAEINRLLSGTHRLWEDSEPL